MTKETDALQAQIDALKSQIAALTGHVPHEKDIPLEERPDYMPHGSDEHAAWLGLRKATERDKLTFEGWALSDITAYGVTAKEEMLEAILMQKVNELSGPPPSQSDNPRAANYAPRIWVPDGIPVSGVVGSG